MKYLPRLYAKRNSHLLQLAQGHGRPTVLNVAVLGLSNADSGSQILLTYLVPLADMNDTLNNDLGP
jgi:hypothetical protein